MTNSTDTIKDALLERMKNHLLEAAEEARRDDRGKTSTPLKDPSNAVTDDHGNRKRPVGADPDSEAQRKAREQIEAIDAIEPTGGRPSDADGDADGDDVGQKTNNKAEGEVPDPIAAVANSEGW